MFNNETKYTEAIKVYLENVEKGFEPSVEDIFKLSSKIYQDLDLDLTFSLDYIKRNSEKRAKIKKVLDKKGWTFVE